MTEYRRRLVLALIAVFAVAVAFRSGPLLQSPLPFNPDGIIHATHAEGARAGGTLPLDMLAPDDLLFTSFLVVLADVTGVEPLLIAQPVIAVVGTIPCLVGAFVACRITRRMGWPRQHRAFAAVLAAGLLAIQGFYLHRSMAVDEQTLGLLFVPLAVVAVAIATWERSRSWGIVAAILLVALPATHNLDSMVAALALTALAGLAVSTGRRKLARPALAFATIAWVAFVGYTVGVHRLTPATIIQSERITGVPGLFLAWILLVMIVLPWFVRARTRTQRGLAVATFGTMLALVLVNAVFPIFPRGPATQPLVVFGVIPLLALAIVAGWATPATSVGPEGRSMAALAGGVLVLIGLSLTAALTPEYQNLVYRAQTFIHLPAMTATALGVVALLQHRRASQQVTATVTALVLIAALASVPAAYGGLTATPYKGVTTPAEYETSQFARDRVEGAWAADNHVARITWAHEKQTNVSGTGGVTIPVYEWLVSDGPPPRCPTVVQRSWSTVGAQMFPLPPATFDHDTRRAFQQRGHVVYATAGTADPLRIVVPRNQGEQC